MPILHNTAIPETPNGLVRVYAEERLGFVNNERGIVFLLRSCALLLYYYQLYIYSSPKVK